MNVNPTLYFEHCLLSKDPKEQVEALHILWFSDCIDGALRDTDRSIGIRATFVIHVKETTDILDYDYPCEYCLLFDDCKKRHYPEKYSHGCLPPALNIHALIRSYAKYKGLKIFFRE